TSYNTRGQYACNNWHVKRAGRITASKFKAVCRTNKESLSLSLIKSICYPVNASFTSKATDWGLRHENVAVGEYQKQMEEKHEHFSVTDVGIFVSSKWPQLGASPDRLVRCECCLGGGLKVKCPYLLHTKGTKDIKEYARSKNSCIELRHDNTINLKKDHTYY
ncbi:uncharacterized protein LOC123306265, partial [Coccinella septempunctata]|uniref:uncharacterized protein LOC123306265 n=1 Tax=Coccinella septempunctata TaxID=41139 RepID=UPI001D06BF43